MRTVFDKRERLLENVRKGIIGIRCEIEKTNAGLDALDGLRQLLFMESKLLEMEQTLMRDDWRSFPKPKPGIARLVVDTWPLHDPLGILLSEIEYEYDRLE